MTSSEKPRRPAPLWPVEAQTAEKLIAERGTLGCKRKCHILNDFLSVDSNQPLSD